MLALLVLAITLFLTYLDGGFNKLLANDIASFESPDGRYVVTYQQLGSPEFPYGQTEVRLVLSEAGGKTLTSTDVYIQNDGANASEDNVKSLIWAEDGVTVVLQASEMEDKTIVLTR